MSEARDVERMAAKKCIESARFFVDYFVTKEVTELGPFIPLVLRRWSTAFDEYMDAARRVENETLQTKWEEGVDAGTKRARMEIAEAMEANGYGELASSIRNGTLRAFDAELKQSEVQP